MGYAFGGFDTHLPVLNSNPGAHNTLYLNFLGSRMDADFFANATSLPQGNLRYFHDGFDMDGDPSSFNATEQAVITQVWKYVADKYAPFDINVTTQCFVSKFGTDAYHSGYGNVLEVAIGGINPGILVPGDGSLALGADLGVGTFWDSTSPKTVFAFSGTVYQDVQGNLPSFEAELADVISHEAGHAFGLYHQSVYDGDTLKQEYVDPTADWSPIVIDHLKTGHR